MALLHPDPHDPAVVRPVAPAAVLGRLLEPIAEKIGKRAGFAAQLADLFGQLDAIPATAADRAVTLIVGKPQIDAVLGDTLQTAREEVLTVQPGSTRNPEIMQQSLRRSLTLIGQGVRLRHLYQHPARYNRAMREYVGQLPPGGLEVRTVEATIERTIILDRTVAFVPAAAGREAALEIRDPNLVACLVQVYETLWAYAIPITEQLKAAPADIPVTAVQRSIARLLAEGHTDDAVSRRLGINVRTCRAHISRLMQTIGATNRTQLGARLVQSGIAQPSMAAENA
ncbi:LuxR C-terminal-related transcriptional regulator [Streptomyces sp. NPDC006283]|uniref:helix-turn-helix transcriptional regulator n=1 Tax=Streptomyces sp. NPDC006283 TaxID=3156741 RepID=UPI0033B1C768